MRALQKLCRCGNSTHFAIPKSALFWLGWVPGQSVIVEVLEDKSLHVRLPVDGEFRPLRAPSVMLDASLPAAK